MFTKSFHYNLIDPLKSIAGYRIIKFPDGEKQIELEAPLLYNKVTNTILTRLSSVEDIFILLQLVDILRRFEISYEIHVTYIIGQRNDRIMSMTSASNFKIIMDMIERVLPDSVMELHNPKSHPYIIKNVLSTLNIIKWDNYFKELYNQKKLVLVLPDYGAYNRYKEELMMYPKVITATKVRNNTKGEPSMTVELDSIILPKIDENDEFTVIDDLCDGGRTFTLLAAELRKLNPKMKLNLVVTHAVNMDGLLIVSKYYDNVFITNSYQNWDKMRNLPENVKVVDCDTLYYNV
jgi:hypothetical protein